MATFLYSKRIHYKAIFRGSWCVFMLNFFGGVDVQMSRCPPCLWKNGAVRCSSRCTLVASGPGHLGSQDANGDLESASCILPRIDPKKMPMNWLQVFALQFFCVLLRGFRVWWKRSKKKKFDLIWFDLIITSCLSLFWDYEVVPDGIPGVLRSYPELVKIEQSPKPCRCWRASKMALGASKKCKEHEK